MLRGLIKALLWAVGTIVIAAAGCVAALMLFVFVILGLPFSPPSDDEMIWTFNRHRKDFETIAVLTLQTANNSEIDVKRRQSNEGGHDGVADQVRALLKKVDASSAEHRKDGSVYVLYRSGGLLDDTWYKAFVWLPAGRTHSVFVVPDLNELREKYLGEPAEGWRPIDGNWYLHYFH